jgi:hypothetical protein
VPGNNVVKMDANKRARERNSAALYCYMMCCTSHDTMNFF